MTTQEIKQYVYDFLHTKGLPHISICAVMGNITAESNFDPNIVEHGNNIGFGLCQWSFSRREQLEAYGVTLAHQCEFLWSELTGENTATTGAEYQWISNPADSVDNGEGFSFSNADFLNGNGSIETLTKAFCYCWERPAYETNHLTEIRIPSAIEFYNTMSYGGGGGETPPDNPDDPNPPATETKKRRKYKWVLFRRGRKRTWINKHF